MWLGMATSIPATAVVLKKRPSLTTKSTIISKVGINIYNKADNAPFDANGHLASDARILDGYKDDWTGILPTHVTVTAREYNLSGESAMKRTDPFRQGYLNEDG